MKQISVGSGTELKLSYGSSINFVKSDNSRSIAVLLESFSKLLQLVVVVNHAHSFVVTGAPVATVAVAV